MKINPVNDQVLIKVDVQETKSKGGLFLAPSEPVAKNTGVVVAVGDSKVISVKPGDRVVFEKGMGRRFDVPVTEVSDNGLKWTTKESHILIPYFDVIGVERED